MKSICNKRKLLLLFFILFAWIKSFSQNNPILDSFKAINNNGKVYLNWVISSGSTCSGIQIYRSTDSQQFEIIWDIPGVCGSSSSPQAYDFTDINPVKNRINYYRLELGGNGSSEIVSVEIIDINDGGFQIRPNPVSEKARIYFANDKNRLHYLWFHSVNGTCISSMSSKEDYFDFDSSDFSNGLYLFTITNDEGTIQIKDKILVQH